MNPSFPIYMVIVFGPFLYVERVETMDMYERPDDEINFVQGSLVQCTNC